MSLAGLQLLPRGSCLEKRFLGAHVFPNQLGAVLMRLLTLDDEIALNTPQKNMTGSVPPEIFANDSPV